MKKIYIKYKKIILLIPSILLIILTMVLSISNAYYYSRLSMPIIHAVVGNKYSNKYDYVLLVYIEDNSHNYILTNNLPSIGYELYNYSCLNGSFINYDNTLNNVSVLLDKKDVCSIYFNKMYPDIVINYYILEDNEYIKKNPLENELYNINNELSNCTNNSSYNYNDEYINININKKDICNIYLDNAT